MALGATSYPSCVRLVDGCSLRRGLPLPVAPGQRCVEPRLGEIVKVVVAVGYLRKPRNRNRKARTWGARTRRQRARRASRERGSSCCRWPMQDRVVCCSLDGVAECDPERERESWFEVETLNNPGAEDGANPRRWLALCTVGGPGLVGPRGPLLATVPSALEPEPSPYGRGRHWRRQGQAVVFTVPSLQQRPASAQLQDCWGPGWNAHLASIPYVFPIALPRTKACTAVQQESLRRRSLP